MFFCQFVKFYAVNVLATVATSIPFTTLWLHVKMRNSLVMYNGTISGNLNQFDRSRMAIFQQNR